MSFFICKILRKFDRLYYFNFATTSSPNSCSASFAGREVGFRLIVTWASPCSENEIIFSRLFYVANGALFEDRSLKSAKGYLNCRKSMPSKRSDFGRNLRNHLMGQIIIDGKRKYGAFAKLFKMDKNHLKHEENVAYSSIRVIIKS